MHWPLLSFPDYVPFRCSRKRFRAGVTKENERVRFGFCNFRHSLASSLVKLKCDQRQYRAFCVFAASSPVRREERSLDSPTGLFIFVLTSRFLGVRIRSTCISEGQLPPARNCNP